MNKTEINRVKKHFGLREDYQKDLEDFKKKYFKKALLAYMDLCFFCGEEPTIYPTVSRNIAEIVMEKKTMSKILEEVVKNIQNYDEYFEKILSEIERLEEKAKEIITFLH